MTELVDDKGFFWWGWHRLYYRGLFRGHPAKPYYEAIDDVGDLLSGLVSVHRLGSGFFFGRLALAAGQTSKMF